MGLRNPSRLSIDPKTDIPYTAWVGPDAGAPSRTEGPSTYENAAQVTHAGNYGWPYCMGNKQPYRDRLDGGALRTDSPSGYQPGGPATGGTEGWYDCDNLRNDSPNNTGLVVFPHATGTGADAGKVRGNNLWYSRGNPGSNNGCPDFPRPRGAGTAPDYGATPVVPVPLRAGQRHDDHGRPGLSLRQGRGRPVQALARVLGRALVPAQQRRSVDQARPAPEPGHRRDRRPAGLRRQPARHADLEQRVLHGLQVRQGRRALRPDL